MEVTTKAAAWRAVNDIFPGPYGLDAARTNGAGYDIFSADPDPRVYVCDLGDRLEVNLADGRSVNVWIRPAEPVKAEPGPVEAILQRMEAGGVSLSLALGRAYRFTTDFREKVKAVPEWREEATREAIAIREAWVALERFLMGPAGV